jgi:hypothetical protein
MHVRKEKDLPFLGHRDRGIVARLVAFRVRTGQQLNPEQTRRLPYDKLLFSSFGCELFEPTVPVCLITWRTKLDCALFGSTATWNHASVDLTVEVILDVVL